MVKKGGNRKFGDPIAELLTKILDQMRLSDAATETRFQRLETRFEAMERVMIEGFASVNGRLDNVLAITGGRYRDLDTRVTNLESDVMVLKTKVS